ncbi:serine hydrolase domain-containing protein [Reichenbachiella sp. MALMAid0571]|uniref:serine hydrolase domain-containing protein n=1 Tax=Reichenbachiella sp. MALMAid0571 TaxID=3143939 RepID=UPI0032DF5D14
MKIINVFRLLLTLSISLLISCKHEIEIDFNSFGPNPSGNFTKEESLIERMNHYKVPGVSIAVVDSGGTMWAKGFGIANTVNGKKVGTETLFQAGSISKPIAALSVLKLFEEGKVDLDEDVNTYLKDWKIPENKFTVDQKVSVRRLLTHTAGVTVHGFPGYRQGDSIPSIQMILNGEGNTGVIYVDTIPGSTWRYSGGGYTIIEKLVEDISGLSFEEYLGVNILRPMGMKNSTYEQPLPSDLHASASAAYTDNGKIIEGLWHNYPEHAAAGLWTTPTDLVKFCIEIQKILSGKTNGVLSRETVELMLTKHMNNWGLGVSLENDHDSLTFGHRGKNAGFTNYMVSFVHKDNTLVIMANGDNGRELINEIQRSVFNYYQW